MGRIVTSLTIANAMDPSKSLRCDALVDTGASHLTLPSAWKERLGDLEQIRTVEVESRLNKCTEALSRLGGVKLA